MLGGGLGGGLGGLLGGILALALFLGITLAAPSARADVRVHEAAKVSLDVPAGFKVDAEDNVMTLTGPDDDIAFFLMVLDASDLKKAMDALDSEVSKSFQGVTWEDEPKTTKLNGMDAFTLDGAAKADGKAVELGVLLVATPAKKILMVLGAVEKAKSKKYDRTVERFIASIKPAK
jgi:predicted Zn-dependent protease